MSWSNPPFFVRFYSAGQMAEEILRHPRIPDKVFIRKAYVTEITPLPAGDRLREDTLILSYIMPSDAIGKAVLSLGRQSYWSQDEASMKEVDDLFDEQEADWEEQLKEIFSDIPVEWAPGEFVSAAEAAYKRRGGE